MVFCPSLQSLIHGEGIRGGEGVPVSFCLKRRANMLKNARLQAVIFLVAGALLGYLAAAGHLGLHRAADAAPPGAQATGDRSADAAACPGPCCTDGAEKGVLVAQAAGGGAGAQAQPGGKKPNILFIMGDDIGWFNIGAYHRGMMSGKTPNLDKL